MTDASGHPDVNIKSTPGPLPGTHVSWLKLVPETTGLGSNPSTFQVCDLGQVTNLSLPQSLCHNLLPQTVKKNLAVKTCDEIRAVPGTYLVLTTWNRSEQ